MHTLGFISISIGLLAYSTHAELLHRLPLAQDAPYHYFFDQNLGSGVAVWSGATAYDGYGDSYNGHKGTDFSSLDATQVDGWEIFASAGGWIIERTDGIADTAYEDTANPNGNFIRLYHDNGQQTVYIHMVNGSVSSKSVGEWVAAGEYLGRIGRSGETIAEHLHYEIKEYNYTTDAWVSFDPFDGYNRPGGGATWDYISGTTISAINRSNPYRIGPTDAVELIGLGSSSLSGRSAACGTVIASHSNGDQGVVRSGPVFCNDYLRWQVEWDSGLTTWVAGRWLRKRDAVAVDTVDMSRYTVRPNESFNITYAVTSSFGGSGYLLGCSFYEDGTLAFYDSDNDEDISLQSGTHTYTRTFTVPDGVSVERYAGSFEIWRDDNNDGAIDGGADAKVAEIVVPNILNVVGQAIGGSAIYGEPFLYASDFSIDDDDGGESWGNGDGRASPGEAIEIDLELTNIGGEDTDNVEVEVIDSVPGTIGYDDTLNFNLMKAGEKDDMSDFDIDIPYGFSDSEFTLTLQITCDDGVFYDYLTVPVEPLVDVDEPEITDISIAGGATHPEGSTPNLAVDVRDLSGIVEIELWQGSIGPIGDVHWSKVDERSVSRSQEVSTSFALPSLPVGHYMFGVRVDDDQGNTNDDTTSAAGQDLFLMPNAGSELPSLNIHHAGGIILSWPKMWSGFALDQTSDFSDWTPATSIQNASTATHWQLQCTNDPSLMFFRLRME